MWKTRVRFARAGLIAAQACVLLNASCNLADGSDAEHLRTKSAVKVKADQIPLLVAVKAGTVTSGFASGVLREDVELAAFRITKHPITRRQYRQCVKAGACDASKEDACSEQSHMLLGGRGIGEDASPQVCLRSQEAQSYCHWIKGKLPTLAQWLVAARGPAPARYAWGNDPPTCQQHPRAADTAGAFPSEDAAEQAGCIPPADSKLVIGEHPDGASPSGAEDVLLTPGELLASEEKAQFAACTGKGGCFVFGASPGALDSVYAMDTRESVPENAKAPHVYGFRCALEEN